MPTWFPNIRLEMLALSAEQKAQLLETGWLREVAFKTEPRVNKVCGAAGPGVGEWVGEWVLCRSRGALWGRGACRAPGEIATPARGGGPG
jgi:hypothetical protein